MAAGAEGGAVIFTTNDDGLLFPQAFAAETVILPGVPATALMLVLLELPVHPCGKVHTYEVAPFTAPTLKFNGAPIQALEFPIMLPGVAGIAVLVTLKLAVALLPHALFALTLMVPETPVLALMLDVLELPDQPEGKVQV